MKDRQPALPDCHRFMHEAMNTTFVLRISTADHSTAQGMARECIDQIDYLESRLSRFIEGSDISRINHLKAGETLNISDACHRCLLASIAAYQKTGGLFDITLGRQIEHRKSAATAPPPALSGSMIIHPDTAAVTCHSPGRELDLGGIGKGFALDELRQLLTDWGAAGGLLAAGASSLLAFGPDAWPVDLTGTSGSIRISLADQSLSASGSGIQGCHIVHPVGGEVRPENSFKRVWVTATTATLAEIWSTALMLADPKDLPHLITSHTDIWSVHTEQHDTISSYGNDD
jgi:thiamine biosynthesis lipoprotein